MQFKTQKAGARRLAADDDQSFQVTLIGHRWTMFAQSGTADAAGLEAVASNEARNQL